MSPLKIGHMGYIWVIYGLCVYGLFINGLYMIIYVYGFPKTGAPLNHPNFTRTFPWKKPSSYGVSPISGNPHMGYMNGFLMVCLYGIR